MHSVERSYLHGDAAADPLLSLSSLASASENNQNIQNQTRRQTFSQSLIQPQVGAGVPHKRAFSKLLGLSSLSRPEAVVLWDVGASAVFDFSDARMQTHPASRVRLTGADLLAVRLFAPASGAMAGVGGDNAIKKVRSSGSGASTAASIETTAQRHPSDSRAISLPPAFLLVQQNSLGDVYVQRLFRRDGKEEDEGEEEGDSDPVAARRRGGFAAALMLVHVDAYSQSPSL